MTTIINYFLIMMGMIAAIFWIVILVSSFIVEHCKGSPLYYWVRKHIVTDEDLEPLD